MAILASVCFGALLAYVAWSNQDYGVYKELGKR